MGGRTFRFRYCRTLTKCLACDCSLRGQSLSLRGYENSLYLMKDRGVSRLGLYQPVEKQRIVGGACPRPLVKPRTDSGAAPSFNWGHSVRVKPNLAVFVFKSRDNV